MSERNRFQSVRIPIIVLLMALMALSVLVGSALAITNGQADVDGEYTNVGLLLVWFNGEWYTIGSVTLISENVGLVSGDSAALLYSVRIRPEIVYVTFSADISTLFDGQPGEDVALIPVSGYRAHPGRISTANQPNPYNVGLVFLAEPVTDIEPVHLPDEQLLDDLWAAGAMQPGGAAESFTVVGYGAGQDSPSADPYFTEHRHFVEAQALAVKTKELLLRQNQAAGNGGACHLVRVDWGSPALWTNESGERLVTALFSWSENCNSRGAYYRIDIPEALDFIQESQEPKCANPPAGLVSLWPGDGNADDVVDHNNGILMGDATFAPGMVGQAFSFDGDGDYVMVPWAANLDVGGQLTIELWMNVDLENPMNGCCQGVVSTNTYEFAIIGGSDPVAGMGLRVSTDNGYAITSDLEDGGYPLNPGEWYHVAGVYDGAHVLLYVNGELVVEPPALTGTIWPMLDNSFLAIGSEDGVTNQPGGIAGERYFHGLIDEVSLYNRALSAEEIQAIYQGAAVCRD